MERIQIGKALRATHRLKGHARWHPAGSRRDPMDVLEESNRDRLPELVPIRYGRMLRSPFAFLPSTGIAVQACGDCHLLNFRLFATP